MLYLDSSALVKRYVAETGSRAVHQLIDENDLIGTSIITRTEVASALAKAVRVGWLDEISARRAYQLFEDHWADFLRLSVTENTTGLAATYTWHYGLRAYDAMHLAAAFTWQSFTGAQVTFATFDQRLWASAKEAGLALFPADLGG